jgi:hypothetical protein
MKLLIKLFPLIFEVEVDKEVELVEFLNHHPEFVQRITFCELN